MTGLHSENEIDFLECVRQAVLLVWLGNAVADRPCALWTQGAWTPAGAHAAHSPNEV